jgi:hypothetical protein
MNTTILILSALAVLTFLLRSTTEHMTNDDLISALKTFGEKGTPPKKKKQSGQTDELPIYGPKGITPPPQPKAAPITPGSTNPSDYPEIFGPEIILTPGKKKENGKHESDSVTDQTYDFNPDLKNAFPTSGPPQPFTGDFSKFQH